jgi:hypothetical protein
MFAHIFFLLTAVAAGVNVGWQPLDDGGMEYIIQLDPQSLEALKSGESIRSDVLPEAGDVRSYKIVVGAGKPPRNGPPQSSAQATNTKTAGRDAVHSPTLPDGSTPNRTSLSPHTLTPDQTAKPLAADSASYIESVDGSAASETGSPNPPRAKKEEQEKPWLPLILVSLGLFASLGGNLYLAWIFADLRRRCRASISASGQLSK